MVGPSTRQVVSMIPAADFNVRWWTTRTFGIGTAATFKISVPTIAATSVPEGGIANLQER